MYTIARRNDFISTSKFLFLFLVPLFYILKATAWIRSYNVNIAFVFGEAVRWPEKGVSSRLHRNMPSGRKVTSVCKKKEVTAY